MHQRHLLAPSECDSVGRPLRFIQSYKDGYHIYAKLLENGGEGG